MVNLYDLMDAAYDVATIKKHSRSLGHVPIIAINPRRDTALEQDLVQEEKRQAHIGCRGPEHIRYNQRSSAERVNGALEDNHGPRTVRVRDPNKVMCHLMFAVLTVAVTQIFRLVT